MKILIVTGLDLEKFIMVGSDDPAMPKQPQAYPYYGNLKRQGFDVKILSLSKKNKNLNQSNQFYPYIRSILSIKYISSFDVIISWGFIGSWLSIVLHTVCPSKKILTVVFANHPPGSGKMLGRFKNILFHKGLRQGKASIYMTKEQLEESIQCFGLLPEQAFYMPAGVDTKFFMPLPVHETVFVDSQISKLSESPYVIVAGDMLRDELQIAKVLKGKGLKLVRLTQSTNTESFWKDWLLENKNELEVFCRANLKFHEVRYIYQHGMCLLNLIDNSWQPAGWTVMTEAMACGIPVIMNSGLVTRELKSYKTLLPIVEINSPDFMPEVESVLDKISKDKQFANEIGIAGRKFVETYLNIENVSKCLVSAF